MSSLVITKQTGNFFSLVLDGGEPIISEQNRLTTIGDYCNFKTANGANLILKQNILFSEITIVTGITYVPISINDLWITLLDAGFFDGIASTGGTSTVDRFTDLLDTFTSYIGKDGQILVVNESQQKIETIAISLFTAEDKTKLDGIETGAQVNVQSDAAESDPSSPAYIKNFPEIGLGYTPENEDNKISSITAYSEVSYPNEKATHDALDLKQTVFTGICQKQYLTENDIVIDNTALTLTIETVKNGTSISSLNPIRFFTDGSGVALMHEKTAAVVFNFTNTTGVWYFYFNSSGTPIATQTVWNDFATIATVYRFYWNATLSVADRRVIDSVEYHKNDISWSDHAWKHLEGAKWSSGLEISSNAISTGIPNVNGSNAVIVLSSGTILDDNIYYTVTSAASGTTKFTQDLGSGLLPATSGKFICITNNAGGLLDKLPATDFPFLWDSGTNTPQYLTVNGTRTAVTANYYFVYYVYALQDPRRGETIKIKSAETDFANITLANAHSWEQLQTLFPTLKDGEIRLLYKMTFEYKTSYDIGTKKSALRFIDDLRKQKTTTSAIASGSLPATSVTVSPVGGIASTNVQSALQELDSETLKLAGTTVGNPITGDVEMNGRFIKGDSTFSFPEPPIGDYEFATTADLANLQPKGLRITNATTTGSYAVDWNAADVWQLTLTGATTITDSNLPTGPATKVIEFLITGAFAWTPPAYWVELPSSQAYDGAKQNHVVVTCINGTASSELVYYSNETTT